MKKRILVSVLAMFLLPAASGQDTSAASYKDKLLVRMLRAITYAQYFKEGTAAKKPECKKSCAYIEAVMSADDSQIEEIAVDVYGKYFPLNQLEEIVRFYESPSGKAVLVFQRAHNTNKDSTLTLDSMQVAEFNAFCKSPAGTIVKEVLEDQKIQKELLGKFIHAFAK